MGSATTRREFLETTTGLVIAFALPWRVQTAAGPAPFAPNAWLRIGADGIVTLTIDRAEMGQGSQTGLALILAEELEADWSTIRLGPMPENPAGWSRIMRTGGSNAIRSSWEPLRKAGATAREMLLTAAAETWKVDRATCRAGRAPRGGARAELVDGRQRRVGSGMRGRRGGRGGYILAGTAGTAGARDRVGRGGLGRARFAGYPRSTRRARRSTGNRGSDRR